MARKKMEGSEEQRRKRAREAREDGKSASEVGATTGSSKQRRHLGDEGHEEKVEAIREGKQDMLTENTPEVRPRSRGGNVYSG